MKDFDPVSKYQREPPKQETSKYPVERLILRAKEIGLRILNKSQEEEQPLTPLGDFAKYKKRRQERRWRDGS